MSDHAALTPRGWREHDLHLTESMKFTRQSVKSFETIDRNGREIAKLGARISLSLGLDLSTDQTSAFFNENMRGILHAPHNPEMTKAAIREHHQCVEKTVRLLEKQIAESIRLTQSLRGIHRHQRALMMMFKRRKPR